MSTSPGPARTRPRPDRDWTTGVANPRPMRDTVIGVSGVYRYLYMYDTAKEISSEGQKRSMIGC